MSVLCAVMAGLSWTRAIRTGDDEGDIEIKMALRRKRQPFMGAHLHGCHWLQMPGRDSRKAQGCLMQPL